MNLRVRIVTAFDSTYEDEVSKEKKNGKMRKNRRMRGWMDEEKSTILVLLQGFRRMTVLAREAPLVISPEQVATADDSIQASSLSIPIDKKTIRKKKGKVFATSITTLKALIESVNEQQDLQLEAKRSKEMENEKNLAARIEKYEAKRSKKKQILEKVKERLQRKKKRQQEVEKQQEQKKEEQNQKNNEVKRTKKSKK